MLRGTNLQGAGSKAPTSQDSVLDDANLQNAWADEHTRWPAAWDRAQAEARGVQYGYPD